MRYIYDFTLETLSTVFEEIHISWEQVVIVRIEMGDLHGVWNLPAQVGGRGAGCRKEYTMPALDQLYTLPSLSFPYVKWDNRFWL